MNGFNQSKQVCVSKTEQSINSNLKSADAPRPIDSNLKSPRTLGLGLKILRQLWANLRQRPSCSKKTSHHLYYSSEEKGNLHLNKKQGDIKGNGRLLGHPSPIYSGRDTKAFESIMLSCLKSHCWLP
ncbi:hypothetical protein H5410_023271 [Solanum commersonii]|uniref:Uncharacterized protein n=1 Tax=Solanum commersonii TaxID=4109 RepID=A0A9J5ZK01_SOLCO|nr:hypothetical protein H5410_023271 [Solanum commersonii]